jgi:hypothetical protein
MCSCTAEQAANSASDLINSISTSDSAEVKSVRDAYITQYSSTVTVGTAIDNFLGDPKWSYFVADTGEKIVQCVGKCTYNDETVEAKVQFLLNDDGTFGPYALALNDMSQDNLTFAMFMEKLYEKYSTSGSVSYAPSAADTSYTDTSAANASTANTSAANTTTANTSAATSQQTTYTSSSSGRNIFVVDNDKYMLNTLGLEDGTLDQLNQKEVRILLNALYAYHGYSFTTEEYQRFFASKPWYSPSGKSMEACEAEFNQFESFNKSILVQYEKDHGWR